MDEWGCFPYERQRLFDLFGETHANGVILLSGNVNFAEISQVDTNIYPLTEFTSSGLTHVNESYADAGNQYRVAGPMPDLNFGRVEFDWSTTTVTLRACDVNGNPRRPAQRSNPITHR
jgi:alkaline phosphatase D